MNIKQETISTKTAELREPVKAISLDALDCVVGGLNPQPLPPCKIATTCCTGEHFREIIVVC